jgi:hypothetical protein
MKFSPNKENRKISTQLLATHSAKNVKGNKFGVTKYKQNKLPFIEILLSGWILKYIKINQKNFSKYWYGFQVNEFTEIKENIFSIHKFNKGK